MASVDPNPAHRPASHIEQSNSNCAQIPSGAEETTLTPDNDNGPRLVSLNDACAMTSMSRSMVNKYRAEGRFPLAVPLGDKRVAFVKSEVITWISDRIAARAA